MTDYFRKNKWTLLITSVVILLPILAGVLLWDKLPEKVPFHWGINGEVDGWASRPVAVFLMPCLLLAIQWLCFFLSQLDPKQKGNPTKMLGLVLWIVPVMNILLNVMIYLTAMGRDVNIAVVLPLFFGALFVVIGNYLPKCRQSYTIGIKLPWTLADEETWNATHRMAGKLWVAGGLLTMPCALLPAVATFAAMMGILLGMLILPTVYAYRFYQKKQHHT